MLRHKYKIILKLDINCGKNGNLESLIRDFKSNILNTVFGLNINSDIRQLNIEASEDAFKTTLIATISIKMSKRDYIRFLCSIYQKYPDNVLKIF